MVGSSIPTQAMKDNGSETFGSGSSTSVPPGSINASKLSTLTFAPSQHQPTDANPAWDTAAAGTGAESPARAQGGLTIPLQHESSPNNSEGYPKPSPEAGTGEEVKPTSATLLAAPQWAVSPLRGAMPQEAQPPRVAAGPEGAVFSQRGNHLNQEGTGGDLETSSERAGKADMGSGTTTAHPEQPQEETRTSDRSGGNMSWWPAAAPVPGDRNAVLAMGTPGSSELSSPWQWLPNKRGEGPASGMQGMSAALPLRPYSFYAPLAAPPAADAGLPWWATEAVQSVAAYTGKLPFPPEPMGVEGAGLPPERQEAGGGEVSHAAAWAPAAWSQGPTAAGLREGGEDEDLGLEGISMIGELSSEDADAIIADEIQRLWPDQVRPGVASGRVEAPAMADSGSVPTISTGQGPAVSQQGAMHTSSGVDSAKTSANGVEAASSPAVGPEGASPSAMSPEGISHFSRGPQDASQANTGLDRGAAAPTGLSEQSSEMVTARSPGPAAVGEGGALSVGPGPLPAVGRGAAPVEVVLGPHQYARPGVGAPNHDDTPAFAPDNQPGQAAEAPAPQENRHRRRQRRRAPAPSPGESQGPLLGRPSNQVRSLPPTAHHPHPACSVHKARQVTWWN